MSMVGGSASASEVHSSKEAKSGQQDEAALEKVLMTQDSALVQMLLELLIPHVDDHSGPALQIRAAGAARASPLPSWASRPARALLPPASRLPPPSGTDAGLGPWLPVACCLQSSVRSKPFSCAARW